MSVEQKKIEAYIKKSIFIAKETCTAPSILDFSEPLSGRGPLNVHQVLMILCGSMGIVAVLISLYLLYGHLRYYTKPREQRQYIRIIVFVPFLTTTSFLALTFPNRAGWIEPIGEYYESFAIAALYLFYCRIIVNHYDQSAPVTFQNVKQAIQTMYAEKDIKKQNPGWLKVTWFLVLQISVSRIITFVANEILYGETCPTSDVRSKGSIAISVIQGFCTGLAVAGAIGLERRTRAMFLEGQRPLFKLISFKGIIGLQSLQQIIFTAITATNTFSPTPPFYISENDFSKGLPLIIFMFEMLIVAFMFLWSFHFERYRKEFESGVSRDGSPVMAFLKIFFPLDIFKALFSGF